MLEHAGEAKRKRTIFLNEIIAQQVSDLFHDISTRMISDHEFDHDSIEDLFPDYFRSDKQLGRAIDEEGLMMVAAVCLAYLRTESIPTFFKVDAAELGSSALREAAFLQAVDSHNNVDTVDERLEVVEASDMMLAAAQPLLRTDSERYHRLSLQRAFTPVYKDIVSGEVTGHTVSEIAGELAELRLNTYQIANQKGAVGLLGEIATLQHFWNKYEKKGQHVAIPATMRGGSGRSNPDQTHDIDIIRQKVDDSWIVLSPIEVKRTKITDEIKQRYTRSLLANVSPDGQITIMGDHRELSTQ